MARLRELAVLLCITAFAVLPGQMACGDDDGGGDSDADSDSDSDSDTDTDTDADTDTDTDTDTDADCTAEGIIDWGSNAAVLNQVIGNWQLQGAFDWNHDGVIAGDEVSEATFTMEDLFCYGQEEGAQSVVVLMSDQS